MLLLNCETMQQRKTCMFEVHPSMTMPHTEDPPGTDSQIYDLHAEVCAALASPKRLHIIDVLGLAGEMTTSSLAGALGIPAPNLSQHLAVLRQRRIVSVRREGAHAFYRIADERVTRACGLMREILLAQLEEGGRLAGEISGRRVAG